MKILFAASEAHPLVKTGGLGDVSASLPRALKSLRHDVRLVLPAYQDARQRAGKLQQVAQLILPGADAPVGVLQGMFPGTRIPLYLIDSPEHFDRAGDPYRASNGRDWQDNPQRFALFCRAIAALALDQAQLGWQPDVLHCNDWQTALAPALIHDHTPRPKTVFTIHNLAYQGLFPGYMMEQLALAPALWTHEGLEFHGNLSFIKGGLVYADRLSTVSPSYAEQIKTPEFAYGLEGLLRHREQALCGILNGVDYREWDPRHDQYLKHPYSTEDLSGKVANKHALQIQFGLPTRPDTPLLSHIGRLVEQKGVDLIMQVIPQLLEKHDLQLVILGSGDPFHQQQAEALEQAFPDQVAVHIGYNEQYAHLIEAGSDLFIMPSRFEPCGLNQMYSLRFGTPPIVHLTGGLADTVVPADAQTLADGSATGFGFAPATATALSEAIEQALALFADPARWRTMIERGMSRDFSWQHSARRYINLYKEIKINGLRKTHELQKR